MVLSRRTDVPAHGEVRVPVMVDTYEIAWFRDEENDNYADAAISCRDVLGRRYRFRARSTPEGYLWRLPEIVEAEAYGFEATTHDWWLEPRLWGPPDDWR